MSFTSYLIDGALVALVLLQIKWKPLTTRSLMRPLVIASVAIVTYFNTLPTAGNDLVLIGALGLLGLGLGTAAGSATFMRRRTSDGVVEARAGRLAAILWVLGMGLRFLFLIWISHSGSASLVHFSAEHSITSGAAWTDALLAMAVCEVAGRTAVLALRRRRLAGEVPNAHRAAAIAA